MKRKMVRSAARFALGALALVSGSCGNRTGLYPVSGRVTYNGEPAQGAVVFLVRSLGDLEDKRSPLNRQMLMGVVQPDGSFTIDCGVLGKGAPPGDYSVLIKWAYDHRLGRAPPAVARKDRLDGRFADPGHARLRAVIKAESNQLPPFELSEKKPSG
jgi:hypothetical protein